MIKWDDGAAYCFGRVLGEDYVYAINLQTCLALVKNKDRVGWECMGAHGSMADAKQWCEMYEATGARQ